MTITLIDSWPTSLSSWERAKRTLGGGVSTGLRAAMKPHPLSFTGGSGARLTDVDGNSYLDYVLGWGPVILGHGHPAVTSAVVAQAPHGATYGNGHRLEYEVAERIVDAIPGMDRVLYANTGSEAFQVALRLARAATGRQKYVKFVGHYHGWSDPALIGYRPDADGRLSGPGTRGQSAAALEDVVLAPWGDIEATLELMRTHRGELAAVFVEPVLCNSGVILPSHDFLSRLRDACTAIGAVLVFDEVITGFRVAYGGAVERFGVVPDLVILAKAIAAGYSLAAVAGTAALIDQTSAGVVHAGTYNGNPIVLAAARATLDELSRPGTYETLEEKGRALATGLSRAAANAGVPLAVNQIGPVVQTGPGVDRIDSFDDFLRIDTAWYDVGIVEMLRRGIYVMPGGRWYLSTAHTDADIAATVAAAGEAFHATTELVGQPGEPR